jgi:hypothetical protein
MNEAILPINEYNPYYSNYIKLANHASLQSGLADSLNKTFEFYESIPEGKLNFRYAEGKWTIKEIIQHLLDSERVFSYRALCFARKESIALPGFDQDDYLANASSNDRSGSELIIEYKAIRAATIALFSSFTEDMLKCIGTASGSPMSTRAAGFIIIGHETHHCNIIKERYL